MIYAVIFCILLVGLYLIGRIVKRNLLPEIIISFLIGLNWEIYSAHEWVYNRSKLIMIDVGIEIIPLDVVIAWSVVLSAVILLVYEIMKILNRTSKFAFLVIGWLALFFVGFAIELVGYYGSFWSYIRCFDCLWANVSKRYDIRSIILTDACDYLCLFLRIPTIGSRYCLSRCSRWSSILWTFGRDDSWFHLDKIF